ncbi:MAG: mannonate dehydratase [Bryobacteraceae bacterium]
MVTRTSRRKAIQAAALAAMTPMPGAAQSGSAKGRDWPPTIGADMPKICVSGGRDEAHMRQLKQLGIDYILSGAQGFPWTEEAIRASLDRAKAAGLTVINMMIREPAEAIRGLPGADAAIEKFIQSIRAAGKAGLPIIEYNFYAHRLVEGYYEQLGRGGAGLTAFGYDRVKDLPPLPEKGVHTKAQLFRRAEHFLKAVIPEAEKAGVRLALHPNDPPAPMSRGSEQLMATFEDWKRYLSIVKSPHNGMTFDCGVTRELGEDPVAVCRWMGEREQINHVHFRNVIVRKPYVDYTEVFIDEGSVNMYAVMKELVRVKYRWGLYPEHPRALDIDRNRENGIAGQYAKVGGGGFVGEVYNIAYAKAMLQAVLSA